MVHHEREAHRLRGGGLLAAGRQRAAADEAQSESAESTFVFSMSGLDPSRLRLLRVVFFSKFLALTRLCAGPAEITDGVVTCPPDSTLIGSVTTDFTPVSVSVSLGLLEQERLSILVFSTELEKVSSVAVIHTYIFIRISHILAAEGVVRSGYGRSDRSRLLFYALIFCQPLRERELTLAAVSRKQVLPRTLRQRPQR